MEHYKVKKIRDLILQRNHEESRIKCHTMFKMFAMAHISFRKNFFEDANTTKKPLII